MKVEGDASEEMARSDLSGVASNGGEARGTAAGRRQTWELGLGFPLGKTGRQWEEKEQVGVVPACLASKGAGSTCGREAAWRHGARAHCGDRKER